MGFKKRWGLETSDHVLSLAWSENMLIVTPSTGNVLMVNQDGKTIAGFAPHGLGNGAAAARSDILAMCGFDGRIQTYEIGDSKISPARGIALGKGWIERVRWSPDSSRLASALGKTLFILKPNGELAATFSNHQTSVSDFSWNPKNPLEIASVCGGGARMWRIGRTQTLRTIRLGWSESSRLVES